MFFFPSLTHLMQAVHLKEAALISAQPSPGNELIVNKELIRLEMDEIFNLPRNEMSHPKVRETVGGFIYQKMGRNGVAVAMQDFRYKLPISEMAESMGEKMVSTKHSSIRVRVSLSIRKLME